MKRIAAVAALIVGMLAIPAAAAMASTSSPAQGPWGGQGQYCQPNQFHHPYGKHHRHHRHHPSGFNNCYPPPQPSGYCNGQSFTFTWATDSNSLFEESGPTLYSGEQFSFDGNVYTIGTANPTAGSITLTTVNYGPTIFYGVGYLC